MSSSVWTTATTCTRSGSLGDWQYGVEKSWSLTLWWKTIDLSRPCPDSLIHVEARHHLPLRVGKSKVRSRLAHTARMVRDMQRHSRRDHGREQRRSHPTQRSLTCPQTILILLSVMKKKQYVYMVMWDESYEGPTVYGIFKTEKAAQKAIDQEAAKCKQSWSFRAYVNKLPLNPSELSMNYLYQNEDWPVLQLPLRLSL